jgi:hypothetical protein
MAKYELSEAHKLLASRYLLARKIEQERDALRLGEMAIAPPVEWTNIEGQSREDRLRAWEAMLAEIDQKIENFSMA